MSILKRLIKQPGDFKDYDVDYTPWLTPINDTLDQATITVECLTDPADTSLVVDRYGVSAQRIKLWLRDGTAGNVYLITIKATTSGGRTDESELIFTVRDY